MKDPDFDLVRRCQSAGHDAAFEELFEAYRDRVFNLAVRLLGSHSDAEDVTQEAFLTVFRKIQEFRFSSRFYTWLYRVVYNLCTDLRRKAAGDIALGGGAEEDGRDDRLVAVRDPGATPLESLADEDHRTKMMERALERLSPPLRAAVVLRYVEDLPYHEIAVVLGCSVGTVKSRLSRAHHSLQRTLSPEQIGAESTRRDQG